ncbi:L,D-transpeptidase [Heyndrickxia ginsengihumi]|uniref:L,D-transpeptidase n=1 Tax=Heyndrickxia ginsengihumi TaxID=363870 RepID=A0A0A6VET8_9BACI|nr:L,D-transpeptidase [Heyndrickxia ginsengihumi]KHD85978.1 L,D-transpeptidase [Heyndrickxia ginsengihumi]MBE6182977.1 L,D-transpeptidase [Bacillus sp. (in: firmicutes)]MCM3022800.1 L,D-transpeptidase [Heyndrickxia ginsengihumi]NEY20067.1 L,D-transpeptidase [Heyndrickxia ginsengihumi]
MKYLYTSIVALLAVAIVVGAATYIHKHNSNVAASAAEQTKQKKTAHHTASSQTKSDTTKKKSTKKTIDWNAPSGGPYPTLSANEKLWIDVSINDQKVYIKHNNKTIYTMITSSGLDTNPDNSTPEGTFHVQAERGTWFYSPKYKEGAEYWVSWKNHGEFLFHSVPMTEDKKVIPADAKKLGQKDSHGCFHLTIPDAKWIYDHIPTGTKVVVHK